MELIVMSPTSAEFDPNEEQATLGSPTTPAGGIRYYWDTESDPSGGSQQALFVQSQQNTASSTRFGRQRYHGVELDGSPVEVMAFQQFGERWTFAIDGTIYIDDDGIAVPIGRVEFRTYPGAKGEQRRAQMSQAAGEEGVWWFQSDGRIYRQGADGNVTQTGSIEWRIVAGPAGSDLVIMTRGMGDDDPWTGRLDGVRYTEPR
jgi:hypothetical protein